MASTLSALIGASAPTDPSIWKIRQLRADAQIDLDLDDQDVARVWAGSIVESLKAALQEDQPDSIRFASAEHLLASYLTDAAGGRTGQWYYREFEGLELLSASAKIRTALFNWTQGRGALALLSPQARSAVIRCVTESDAQSIVTFLEAGVANPATVLPEFFETWLELGQPYPEAGGEFRWSLRILLEIAAAKEMDVLPSFAWIAPALARMLAIAGRAAQPERFQLAEWIAKGDLRTLVDVHGTESALRLERLLKHDVRAWMEQGTAAASSTDSPERRSTLFGGALLLLPLIDEARCTEDVGQPGWFRLWLLARCLGGPRAEISWRDPLLRDLCGAEIDDGEIATWLDDLSAEQMSAALAHAVDRMARGNADLPLTDEDRTYLQLPPELQANREADRRAGEIASVLLRSLSWKLPGFSASSFGHIYANFLDFPASLEDHGQRRLGRLRHPPLGLMLNLTGLSRQTYTLSWLDQRAFELFPEA